MTISIQLTPGTEQRYAFLANRTDYSTVPFAREIIEDGIEDREDRRLGAEVLQRVRRGDERVYSANEVKDLLGLRN